MLVLLVNEPDSGHGIYEEPCCTFTKEVQLFLRWPAIQSRLMSLELRELVPEEHSYAPVDLTRRNLVEDEHVRYSRQQWDPEAFSNAWLWATGEEELGFGDL